MLLEHMSSPNMERLRSKAWTIDYLDMTCGLTTAGMILTWL
jgi:hypothetical protein